jgi:hypothetical protein
MNVNFRIKSIEPEKKTPFPINKESGQTRVTRIKRKDMERIFFVNIRVLTDALLAGFAHANNFTPSFTHKKLNN